MHFSTFEQGAVEGLCARQQANAGKGVVSGLVRFWPGRSDSCRSAFRPGADQRRCPKLGWEADWRAATLVRIDRDIRLAES